MEPPGANEGPAARALRPQLQIVQSKTVSSWSAGMPIPVSQIVTTASAASHRKATVMSPVASVYFAALLRRLRSTCEIRISSAITCTGCIGPSSNRSLFGAMTGMPAHLRLRCRSPRRRRRASNSLHAGDLRALPHRRTRRDCPILVATRVWTSSICDRVATGCTLRLTNFLETT